MAIIKLPHFEFTQDEKGNWLAKGPLPPALQDGARRAPRAVGGGGAGGGVREGVCTRVATWDGRREKIFEGMSAISADISELNRALEIGTVMGRDSVSLTGKVVRVESFGDWFNEPPYSWKVGRNGEAKLMVAMSKTDLEFMVHLFSKTKEK